MPLQGVVPFQQAHSSSNLSADLEMMRRIESPMANVNNQHARIYSTIITGDSF